MPIVTTRDQSQSAPHSPAAVGGAAATADDDPRVLADAMLTGSAEVRHKSSNPRDHPHLVAASRAIARMLGCARARFRKGPELGPSFSSLIIV